MQKCDFDEENKFQKTVFISNNKSEKNARRRVITSIISLGKCGITAGGGDPWLAAFARKNHHHHHHRHGPRLYSQSQGRQDAPRPGWNFFLFRDDARSRAYCISPRISRCVFFRKVPFFRRCIRWPKVGVVSQRWFFSHRVVTQIKSCV